MNPIFSLIVFVDFPSFSAILSVHLSKIWGPASLSGRQSDWGCTISSYWYTYSHVKNTEISFFQWIQIFWFDRDVPNFTFQLLIVFCCPCIIVSEKKWWWKSGTYW